MSIVYKNKIIKIYTGFPKLTFDDLKFGDCINSTPGSLHWWPPMEAAHRFAITANLGLVQGIIPFQLSNYPECHYSYSSHTVVNIDRGRYFEVTTPEARYGDFKSEGLDSEKSYIVCRYKLWEIATEEEMAIFFKIFNEFNGTKYDYGQLVAILINSVMGWDKAEYLPILDFGRKLKVCSVLARIAWLKWWEKYALPNNLFPEGTPRPGGPLHAERTPPMLFECPFYNDNTFEIVGTLVGGLV